MKRVALIELPALRLKDEQGKDWTMVRRRETLGSKQILGASLSDNFEVELVNMRMSSREWEFGEVQWSDHRISKIACGLELSDLDPHAFDAHGITVNYHKERELACLVIHHLAATGAKVVVGGSDAIAEPAPYLKAGASAVVLSKDGSANRALIAHLIGDTSSEPLQAVAFPDGRILPQSTWSHPEEWLLPTQSLVSQTLGHEYWEGLLPSSLLPIGMVYPDIGCDRTCDFCETWLYRIMHASEKPGRALGNRYKYQSPERVMEWAKMQLAAGARSIISMSDQFLGRVLFGDGGRQEAIRICNVFRKMGLPFLWPNGLELAKATLGRGSKNGDPTPDEELVNALWGWDGKVGCAHAYIPAERPVEGPKAYPKLLEWKHHKTMLRRIVQAGVPRISYGVIVGLEDDSNETMQALLRHILELRDELKSINPVLTFWLVPFCIRPIPGTPRATALQHAGLVHFSDPALSGAYWTATCDTHYMSYQEVSEWQQKLLQTVSQAEPAWQT